MDIYGYLWISMDIYGYLWISMDIYGYLWISMDIYGYLWISMGSTGKEDIPVTWLCQSSAGGMPRTQKVPALEPVVPLKEALRSWMVLGRRRGQ